jgi:hypothetical protein
LTKPTKPDSRKSITDRNQEEVAVAVAVAKEATDLKVNAEAAEVAVVVIVPKASAVSVPKESVVNAPRVKNAVVVTVVVVAEADHELPFPMVKTDPSLNVLSAVDNAEDTRANLARRTTPSIVRMALVAADAVTRKAVTAVVAGEIRSLAPRTATPPQLKVKLQLKQSPNVSEEKENPEKRSRPNPLLRRKKSDSLSMIT